MKRDLNLVRELLTFVEVNGARLFQGKIQVDGYERDAIIHHLFLVSDAGFIELGEQTLADKGPLVLTWKGYDYLEKLNV